MVSFVQFMAEGEEPPVASFATINSLSLETRASDTCLAVRRAFKQAHELVRFVLDKIVKDEDFPRGPEAMRYLRVWHSRAFQLMEQCGNEIRVISDGTCAHDAALRFAGQVHGSLTMAGITNDDDHLRRVQLPNLEMMIDRLKVEMARALDRAREKMNQADAGAKTNDDSRIGMVIGKTLLSEGNQTTDWPPDEQWHFREGEAAFRGVPFAIEGQQWLLLKRLAKRLGTPVTKAALLEVLPPNVGEESLRSQLARARRILRKAFEIPTSKEHDPLPNLDRGANCAWKLDEKVFPPVSEIQRSLNGR